MRKAFKYNKAKAEGPVRLQIEQNYNPQPWKAEDIVKHMQEVQELLTKPELVAAVSCSILLSFKLYILFPLLK